MRGSSEKGVDQFEFESRSTTIRAGGVDQFEFEFGSTTIRAGGVDRFEFEFEFEFDAQDLWIEREEGGPVRVRVRVRIDNNYRAGGEPVRVRAQIGD